MARKTEKVRFTKRKLAALEPPPPKEDGGIRRRTVWDAKQAHLAFVLSSTGAARFQFYRWVNGRPRRLSLGPFPAVTVEQARREVMRLDAEVAAGGNPADDRRRAREEATLGELFDAYLERYAKPRKRSWKQDVWTFNRHLKPLARLKASAVSREDVERLHARIGRENGHVAANRAVALVSTIYNRTAPDLDNPTKGIQRFRERSRDRFLDAAEVKAFFAALLEVAPVWRDVFFVGLLTGARQANVLGMRWDDLALDRGLWHIPPDDAKAGEPMIVVLTEPVVAVLRRRAEGNGESGWVFPSTASQSGHLESPRRPWRKVLERAGFIAEDGSATVHLHDLRRTLGSWQAMAGSPLTVIGKSLGHRSLTATAVYARIDTGPVRESVSAANQALLAAGGDAARGVIEGTAASAQREKKG